MNWRPTHELRSEVVHDEVKRPSNPAKLKAYNEQLARSVELPAIIPKLLTHDVEWRYMNYGFQFKFDSGPILCWWPRTGAILWQGNNLPSDLSITSIEEAIDSFMPVEIVVEQKIPSKLKMADLLEKPVCLVCGELARALHCDACARTRDDLCNECFQFAHWC